jgi:hypothetical protein
MAMRAVTTVGDGGWVIDHATTADMGEPYATDTRAAELAESYARTMAAQCEREGYRAFYVIVRNYATGETTLRLPTEGVYAPMAPATDAAGAQVWQ